MLLHFVLAPRYLLAHQDNNFCQAEVYHKVHCVISGPELEYLLQWQLLHWEVGL
jgi:hypothetical protein